MYIHSSFLWDIFFSNAVNWYLYLQTNLYLICNLQKKVCTSNDIQSSSCYLTSDWRGCGSGTHVSSLQQFTSVDPFPLSAESPSWYQGQIIHCYLFRLFTSLFFSSFSPPPPRGCTRSCQSCKWRNFHHLRDQKKLLSRVWVWYFVPLKGMM